MILPYTSAIEALAVVGLGTAATYLLIKNEGREIREPQEKLYADMECIPKEHHEAVKQLLQDLRQGQPEWAGYRINHLLRKYGSK